MSASEPRTRRRQERLLLREQDIRIQQLRDLLHPQITNQDILRLYLEESRWDVARAHSRWTRDRERILAGAESDVDDDDDSLSSLSTSSESDNAEEDPDAHINERINLRQALEDLPLCDNIEQERRDAALAFRIRVEEVYDAVLSRSEAILLMNLARWDLGLALATFESHAEARDRLRVAYDGMRDDTDNVDEQSARIAALLDVTERPDWLSIKLFLKGLRWNLVHAVVRWYQEGIMPFKEEGLHDIPQTRPHFAMRVDETGKLRQKPAKNACRAAPEVDQEAWNDESTDYTNPGDEDPPEPIEHGQAYGRTYSHAKTDNKRPPGFIIHAGANKTIAPGPWDPSKLLIEYIFGGQYKYNIFKNSKYRFPDRDQEGSEDDDAASDDDDGSPSPSTKSSRPTKSRKGRSSKPPKAEAKKVKPTVPFDFSIRAHLNDLNNWRRQNFSRVRGDVLRASAQQWTTSELEFFYSLNAEWLAGLKAEFPTVTRRQILEQATIPSATKEDWARRMNERFTGTTPEGATEPRWDRKATALVTMRGRWPKLFVHFRVNPDRKWLAKCDPAEVARLEHERDTMEAVDMLLTAAAVLDAADAGEDTDDESVHDEREDEEIGEETEVDNGGDRMEEYASEEVEDGCGAMDMEE